MKKIVICIIIFLVIYFIPKNTAEEIIIPKEAIRFRVIANSNDLEDQLLKNDIKTSLNNNLTSLLKSSKTIEDSRKIIKENKETIEANIATTLLEHNSNQKYNINYGYNYFPEKEYKGITYQEGEYESLVVTLGDGLGENWWCVLFPPLCLLEAEENASDEIEYQFFVKKIIDKFKQ